MNAHDYIVNYFLNKDKNHVLTKDNILAFNYIESCFFSSVEFIEMISHIEDYFSIQFFDHHLKSEAFSKVGSFIAMINKLIEGTVEC